MGYRKFKDIVGEIEPRRRARIDAIREAARADAVAFHLAESRRNRDLRGPQNRHCKLSRPRE